MNNIVSYDEIAEENNLHIGSNQIPLSVISDHHAKNSFMHFPTKTRVLTKDFITIPLPTKEYQNQLSADKNGKRNQKSKFKEAGNSNSNSNPNPNPNLNPKIPNSFLSKETCSNSHNIQFKLEGHEDKKNALEINSKQGSQGNINLLQSNNSNLTISKPKFVVDDYSFTPEMLLSFQKIPCMPILTPEIISKHALILKDRPNVLSDKTLIIDLDDTLITEHPVFGEKEYATVDKSAIRSFFLHEDDVSITNKEKFVIRPYVLEFLEALYKIFEIVIYTASSNKRARKILDIIDPEHKYFHHIYTRENCFIMKNSIVKDIRLFTNRDIRKKIIIEDNIPCFFKSIRNGIFVPSFDGSKYDFYFKDILKFLLEIKDVEDVREYVHEQFHVEEYWERYKVIYQIRYKD